MPRERDAANTLGGTLHVDPEITKPRIHVVKALAAQPDAPMQRDLPPEPRKQYQHLIDLAEAYATAKRRRMPASPKIMARRLAFCGALPVSLNWKNGKVESMQRGLCRNRLCLVCQITRAGKIRERLEPVVQELLVRGESFLHIMLSIPHSRGDRLADLVPPFFSCLSKFFSNWSYRQHCRGYARGVEVVWNEEHGWHVHVHTIVASRFWAWEKVHETWAAIVRAECEREVQPPGVFVSPLQDVGKGLNEAIGYPFKAADLGSLSHDRIVELWHALRGRRMLASCRAWSTRALELEAARKLEIEAARAQAGGVEVRFTELILALKGRIEGALRMAEALIEELRKLKGMRSAVRILSSYVARVRSSPARMDDCEVI